MHQDAFILAVLCCVMGYKPFWAWQGTHSGRNFAPCFKDWMQFPTIPSEDAPHIRNYKLVSLVMIVSLNADTIWELWVCGLEAPKESEK